MYWILWNSHDITSNHIQIISKFQGYSFWNEKAYMLPLTSTTKLGIKTSQYSHHLPTLSTATIVVGKTINSNWPHAEGKVSCVLWYLTCYIHWICNSLYLPHGQTYLYIMRTSFMFVKTWTDVDFHSKLLCCWCVQAVNVAGADSNIRR